MIAILDDEVVDRGRPTPINGSPNKPAHETVRTALWMAGAMGLTKYLLPWLSLRGIAAVEGLFISSLSLFPATFPVIRHPSLFDQKLLTASFHLSRLFLASQTVRVIAGVIVVGLVIGYFVTGVVLPGKQSPIRWNLPLTLRSTGIAVVGGLASIVLFIPGLLSIRVAWGYGLIAAGFFLGPWLRAQFIKTPADRLAEPSQLVFTRRPTRRDMLRTVPPALALPAALGFNYANLFSVLDNWRFLKAEEAHAREFRAPEGPSDDKSIEVAHLSGVDLRFRRLNPQGRRLVIGIHGLGVSLEAWPRDLEPILKDLDMQGIFPDRPGIGPVSTPWPGHDLADWVQLVGEFANKVWSTERVKKEGLSIIGHSAGGVYALACAKLACVKSLVTVCSVTPLTLGSLRKDFFNYDLPLRIGFLAAEFLPHVLLPGTRAARQQILHDWKKEFANTLEINSPMDRAALIKDEDNFRKMTQEAVMQGPEAMEEDFRRMLSPWPVTTADMARVPIIDMFSGVADGLATQEITRDLQCEFAPNARRFSPFDDMGHVPKIQHWKRMFEQLGKQLDELDAQGKKILSSAA
jgi:pimeloyl-ACP methyl ester carboxylesterase